MKIVKKNIKSNILFVLSFVIILPPTYFVQNNAIWQMHNILSVFILFVLLCIGIFKNKIDKFSLSVLLFLVFQWIITFVNNPTYIVPHSRKVVIVLSIVLLVSIGIKYIGGRALKLLSFVFEFYIFINFILLLLFPNGIYVDNPRFGQYNSGHFLGTDNSMAYFLIPALTVICFYSFYKYGRLTFKSYLYLFFSGCTIVLLWPATAVVAYITFTGLLLYLLISKRSKIINIQSIIVIYGIIFYLIVLAQASNKGLLQYIVVEVLEKNLTFSGRTFIWEEALFQIGNSPIIGYGKQVGNAFITISTSDKLFSAHNVILQILLESGLIGFILISICFLFTVKSLLKFSTHILSKILVIGIFSVLVTFLTEAYELNYLFVLLTIGSNLGYFINDRVDNKQSF